MKDNDITKASEKQTGELDIMPSSQKSSSLRLLEAVAILVFALTVFKLLTSTITFGVQYLEYIISILIVHFLVLFILTVFRGRNVPSRFGVTPAVILGTLIFCAPFAFMSMAFKVRDIGSLLVALQENQIDALAAVAFDGFMPTIAILVIICISFALSSLAMVRNVQTGRFTVICCCLMLVTLGPIGEFSFRMLVPSPAQAKIAPYFDELNPRIHTTPQEKKNLIIVYMESVESTYRNLPETETAFATLAKLEDTGISFRNVQQISGTNSTISGMVASQCGVPYLPKGLLHARASDRTGSKIMPNVRDFMPGVICLGDVLSQHGYTLSYINGSPLSIFSKGEFYRSHGFQNVLGLESFPGWENEVRRNVWGMDDDLLFERVFAELERKAKSGEPFALVTLTISTHGPGGYIDEQCAKQSKYTPLVQAIKCTGDQVLSLLEHVDDLGLSNNTITVIMSDHLAFKNDLSFALLRKGSLRRNYVSIQGIGGAQVITRPATMIDIYPTILEVMGFKLEKGQAGLGISLVSENQTLAEKMTLDELDAALRFNTELQSLIWHVNHQGRERAPVSD